MGRTGALWVIVWLCLGGCVAAVDSGGEGPVPGEHWGECRTAADCEEAWPEAYRRVCEDFFCEHGACRTWPKDYGTYCGGDAADPLHGICDGDGVCEWGSHGDGGCS